MEPILIAILLVIGIFFIVVVVLFVKLKVHLTILSFISFIRYLFPSMWRKEVNRLIEERGMEKRYIFFVADLANEKIDAGATFSNIISLSRGFIKSRNNKECVVYLLGHELTHLRYGDGGKKQLKLNSDMKSKDCKIKYKGTMFNILIEIRADIESAIYSNMSSNQIEQAHKFIETFKEKNNIDTMTDEETYQAGYPPRSERIKYSILCFEKKKADLLDFNFFINDIAKPLLNSYCDFLDIDNQVAQSITSEVLTCFEKDCQGLFLNFTKS